MNKLYSIGDPEFIWPQIEHGIFNDQNKIYNLMAIKCDDTLLPYILGEGYKCKDDNEINNFFFLKKYKVFTFLLC